MPELTRGGALAFLLLMSASRAAEAQTAPQVAATPTAPPAATAVALAIPEAPELDGVLDEAAWQNAPVVSGFLEREPDEGVPSNDDTEVRILFTEDALYIGARMWGRPEDIRADVTRRDAESDAEQLFVSLDTFRDRRTAYTFGVTAAGSRVDYSHRTDNEDDRDFSFDPVWEARTMLDAEGWTAEIRIPFTQLRFSPADVQEWGVNFKRTRPALRNESHWQLVRRNETGWSSRMGALTGIRGVRPSRRIELQPYLATAATIRSGAVAENPFDDPRELSARIGGDVKIGLGPNLTLDLTVNPDFGQVEADPAEVNLSAFETVLQERRPFFTEGASLFNVGNIIYTRRIGARPRGSADADYAEDVDATTILGAAKVTGRLESGLSIGVLGAVTAKEEIRTFDAATGTYGSATLEPLTGYAIARVDQQFGTDASTVGIVLTGVTRDFDGHQELRDRLTKNAASFGLLGRFRWAGGQYQVNWRAVGNHVTGTRATILGLQRSSRRYYQRPDADYVEVDPTRTSLGGYLLEVGFDRTSGEHWLWGVGAFTQSPGLETNDVGQLNAADARNVSGDVTYRDTTPGRYFRSYAVGLRTNNEFNFGGDLVVSSSGLNLNGTLTNFWNGQLGVDYTPRAQDHSATRGGPNMKQVGFLGTFIDITSPPGRRFQVGFGGGGGETALGGWRWTVATDLSYQPGPRVQLSFEPAYTEQRIAQQYVGTFEGGPPATFGARYVFASVDRSEIVARIRLNYAIGPDLTLESYLEPFASSGQYSGFGELVAPRGYDLRVYGEDGGSISRDADGRYVVTDGGPRFSFRNPDFNVRSFRSNVVLRWEWRRGSTLFLVWQQDRSGDGRLEEPIRVGDVWRGISEDGDNYFAVKVTYWIPL